MCFYRFGNWCHQRRIPLLPKLVRNFTYLLFNSYVPPTAVIGQGSVFAYGGIAVVIHARAIIGKGCVLGQGITIGAAEGYATAHRHIVEKTNAAGEPFTTQSHGVPTIGDDCYIGAGARILGGITIGARCTIGANAVVLSDLPEGSIAVGMPAKIIGTNDPHYRAIRT